LGFCGLVLGVGGWGQGPKPQTPNPQSPIPNPQGVRNFYNII